MVEMASTVLLLRAALEVRVAFRAEAVMAVLHEKNLLGRASVRDLRGMKRGLGEIFPGRLVAGSVHLDAGGDRYM